MNLEAKRVATNMIHAKDPEDQPSFPDPDVQPDFPDPDVQPDFPDPDVQPDFGDPGKGKPPKK